MTIPASANPANCIEIRFVIFYRLLFGFSDRLNSFTDERGATLVPRVGEA